MALAGLAATGYAEESKAPAGKPVVATTPPIAAPAVMTDPAAIKTASSYALGFRAGGDFARQYSRFGILSGDLSEKEFFEAFMTAVKGEQPAMEEEQLQAAMQALGNLLQERETELAEKNLEAGKKFLQENGKREGVTTTASGLQYEVLKEGGEESYVAPKEGEAPKNLQFMVHYKGSLIDGTEFDASPEGQPVAMSLNVVPGFREALTTMPVGAKWKIFLPSDLAYGKQRRSGDIGPNSTLVFELELLEIKEPEQPKATPHRAVSAPVRVPPMPKKPEEKK